MNETVIEEPGDVGAEMDGFESPVLHGDEPTIWAFVYASSVMGGVTADKAAHQAAYRIQQLRQLARAGSQDDGFTEKCLQEVTLIRGPA